MLPDNLREVISLSKVLLAASLMLFGGPWSLYAQGNTYAGALGGISTLSADGRSEIAPAATAISLYKPENGPAFSIFVGRNLTDYLSIQANYGWNRNDLTLTSTSFSAGRETLYEEGRSSSQQSALGDLMLYFRNRRSFARPYLAVGTGFVRFHSSERGVSELVGTPALPPAAFSSTGIALRVAVGIDLFVKRGWAFRYSFSETIRGNPVSAQLTPPGQRNLANFENFFGFLKTF